MQSSRGRLIVVDDEPVILSVLTRLFSDHYETVGCASGREAKDAIAGGVDVLLTDKNLPDISGLDLVDAAKRQQPDAEVLILTGFATLDSATAAIRAGVYDYIVKPPRSILEVKRRVDAAFQKQRMSRANRELAESLAQRNRELEEVQSELVQSEKLAGIGTLAAGIAHEINSPLFGVLGLAEAIEDEEDLSFAREYAGDIVRYARQIQSIVSQLSQYSRMSNLEPVVQLSLREVVEDVITLLARTLSLDPNVVEVQVPPLQVRTRATELRQVLVNLIRNALDACEEAGTLAPGCVRVSASEDAGISIAVEDNGPGVPKATVGKLFEPFFTTKVPGKGTGLGLYVSHRIVQGLGGNLVLDTTYTSGARFVVTLP